MAHAAPTCDFRFDCSIVLSATERTMARARLRALKGTLWTLQAADGPLGEVDRYALLWQVSAYRVALQELLAGRTLRYRAFVEVALGGAAYCGDGWLLTRFAQAGVALGAIGRQKLYGGLMGLALIGGHEALAEALSEAEAPGMDAREAQHLVQLWVRHGSAARLQRMLARLRKRFAALPEAQWRQWLGTALVDATLAHRHDNLEVLLALGAEGSGESIDDRAGIALGSTLLSCAVACDNAAVADLCLARGWVPTGDALEELPQLAEALDQPARFHYLCKAFPEANFPACYAEALASQTPCGRKRFSLAQRLRETPELLGRLAATHRAGLQAFLLSNRWHAFTYPPAFFRWACALGLKLFPDEATKGRFVAHTLSPWTYRQLRRFHAALGWQGLRPQSEASRPCTTAEMRAFKKLATLRARALTACLDDPQLNPNDTPAFSPPLAHLLVWHNTPSAFRRWVLRGMDPFGQSVEGELALLTAPMPRWQSLCSTFCMDPLGRAWDGSSALACAIHRHDHATAKWLWRHGEPSRWQGDSPVRLALLACNDVMARWFLRQGLENTDGAGVRHPLPPDFTPAPRAKRPHA